jgi:hypothetical protein
VGGAAWPAASSVGTHRRGPLPAPPLPRTCHQPGYPPLRTLVTAPAGGRTVLPRQASCRRESSQSRALRPTASASPATQGQTLDCELPRQDRHLSGGTARCGGSAAFPATGMALATGPIARSKTGEHDPPRGSMSFCDTCVAPRYSNGPTG